MGHTEDNFTLSYGTNQDVIFDRQVEYTAAGVLAEIADIITHPDNAHVEMVEVRRIGRLDNAVAPDLQPMPLTSNNADAGWSGRVWTASDYQPRGFFTTRPEVLADKLVKLLTDRATERFTLSW